MNSVNENGSRDLHKSKVILRSPKTSFEPQQTQMVRHRNPKARAKAADAGSPKTKASDTGADKYACDDETIARARQLADHAGAESATVGGWSQSAGRETKAQIGFSLNASREEAGGVHRVCEVSMLRTPQCGRGVPANHFLPASAPLSAFFVVGALEQTLRRLIGERDAYARKLVQFAQHETTFHQIARADADAPYFLVDEENCIDFYVVKKGKDRYLVTRTETFNGVPTPFLTLWATRATGTDDIMKSPTQFHFADPVRKLWWEFCDGVWKATALKTTVTLIGAEETPDADAIHARFQNEDWECPPIENSPWPFDSALRFEKNTTPGSLAWKIVDSHGGELMQVPDDDGSDSALVYMLGEKTLRCTVSDLSTGILNDFADFEHGLVDSEDYEEKEKSSSGEDSEDENDGQTCLRCAKKPAATGAWCTPCYQVILAETKAASKAAKKRAKKNKAAAAKKKKRKAAKTPTGGKDKKKTKFAATPPEGEEDVA
jgi:hypothetical protein